MNDLVVVLDVVLALALLYSIKARLKTPHIGVHLLQKKIHIRRAWLVCFTE
jgi:hypothetical protein